MSLFVYTFHQHMDRMWLEILKFIFDVFNNKQKWFQWKLFGLQF